MACGCDPRGPGASVLLSVSIKWPKSISECGGEASSSGTEWLRHWSTIDANQRTELQRPWSLERLQGERSFEQCGSCDQGNQVKKKISGSKCHLLRESSGKEGPEEEPDAVPGQVPSLSIAQACFCPLALRPMMAQTLRVQMEWLICLKFIQPLLTECCP